MWQFDGEISPMKMLRFPLRYLYVTLRAVPPGSPTAARWSDTEDRVNPLIVLNSKLS